MDTVGGWGRRGISTAVARPGSGHLGGCLDEIINVIQL